MDYMENTTRENAVSEELEAIQEMVDVVKEDAEVTVAYMKGFERDQMFLEEGKELGRKLEQENTLREKNRVLCAIKSISFLLLFLSGSIS